MKLNFFILIINTRILNGLNYESKVNKSAKKRRKKKTFRLVFFMLLKNYSRSMKI